MIGLSVARCVLDIARGRVQLDQVKKIIGGILAPDAETMEYVIREYCKSDWRKVAGEAEAIFRKLLAENKIEQPRLINPDHYPERSAGHWVKTEAEIVWHDQL